MAFASFDGKRGQAPVADINMVPLIDVMLVLLVIFIVTAPLLTQAVRLDLPKASAAAAHARPETIQLSIDAQGQRFIDGRAMDRAAAAARFAQAVAAATDGRPAPEMHLRADQGVAYRAVAETLADASQAGLTRIAFVSEPGKP